MNDLLNRYFTGELTEQERNDFLFKVDKDAILKEEFIEIQNLMGFSGFLSEANDKESARLSYYKFVKHINKKE